MRKLSIKQVKEINVIGSLLQQIRAETTESHFNTLVRDVFSLDLAADKNITVYKARALMKKYHKLAEFGSGWHHIGFENVATKLAKDEYKPLRRYAQELMESAKGSRSPKRAGYEIITLLALVRKGISIEDAIEHSRLTFTWRRRA